MEVLETGLVSCICLEFDRTFLPLGSEKNEIEDAMEIIQFAEQTPLGFRCELSMGKVMEQALKYNTQVELVDSKKHRSNKRQKRIAENVKEARVHNASNGRGTLVLIGSDHLRSVRSGDRWNPLQNYIYREDLPQYKVVNYESSCIHIPLN